VLDIVILAVIVAVLVYQLRRVLGERNGAEPTPGADPFTNPATAGMSPLSRAMNAKPVTATVLPDGVPHSDEPLSANQGLQQIKDYDSEFDERAFLNGARAAFEMIIKAYARGDMDILKSLLSPELYDRFADDVKARTAKGMVMDTTLHRLVSATIMRARMIVFDGEVTVEFVSEQTTVIRKKPETLSDVAQDITSIGGVPLSIDNLMMQPREEVRDTWVFRRDTRTHDPIWHLVETHA
jgi:predicted lipid-binding transport protein (Tim44 family)